MSWILPRRLALVLVGVDGVVGVGGDEDGDEDKEEDDDGKGLVDMPALVALLLVGVAVETVSDNDDAEDERDDPGEGMDVDGAKEMDRLLGVVVRVGVEEPLLV
jgi:hypothetical protein